jgi:uncharacterized protein (TIGR02271 family)
MEYKEYNMLTKEEFTRTHPDLRTGMTAYTSDGEKLGVIERLTDDNVIIEKGWFFHKDFLIPYDDIEDIREDHLIIRQSRDDFEETSETEFGEPARETGEYGGSREEEMGAYGPGREEGLSGYGRDRREQEEARIPVREEELEAQKRARESEVEIHKEVYTETERMEVPVQKEDVVVERVPVDETRAADVGGRAFQEEELRIPLKEEEVEVTKRPVVKEEVRVRKDTSTENQEVSGEVRKEKVKVSPQRPSDKEKK